eukprot:5581101-Amphidinium_carterae.1
MEKEEQDSVILCAGWGFSGLLARAGYGAAEEPERQAAHMAGCQSVRSVCNYARHSAALRAPVQVGTTSQLDRSYQQKQCAPRPKCGCTNP